MKTRTRRDRLFRVARPRTLRFKTPYSRIMAPLRNPRQFKLYDTDKGQALLVPSR